MLFTGAPFISTPLSSAPFTEMLRRTKSLRSIRDSLLGGGAIISIALGAIFQFILVPYLQLAVTAAPQILTIVK
ncbi:hypothetical protein FRB97_005085, partial [Tulasnella sp. 331]